MPESTQAWEHLATFVGVAKAGSLTGGAQALGISQPTASRHVAALEEALSLTLFVRGSRGLTLTDDGARVLASASQVAEHVESIFRNPRGGGDHVAGSVRVSAAQPIAGHALAPCIGALLREHRELAIELVLDDTPANLSQREADIAVRMFRPTQLDLVARFIGDVDLGMFASRAYLRSRGTPHAIDDVGCHTLIGFDREPAFHRAIVAMGLSAGDFGYRCDSLMAQIEAVRSGVGIGALHVPLARAHGLVQVMPELSIPSLPIWLVMHEGLRGNTTVRAVFDTMAEALGDYLATPERRRS